jgi:hydroxypyruvate isomerase
MPTFAANLTMLYPDSPFLERFARARASGFRFVEYLFPYEYEPAVLARALAQNNLTQVLFNLPAGNWSAGDRGIAAHPDRIHEFRQGVARALEYASVLGVRQLNCLVGKRDERIPLEEQTCVMIENLRYAARVLAEREMTLLVEHLNPYDVPGF